MPAGTVPRAIVVFGCAVHPSGLPSAPLLRRLETALRLALADPPAWVAVSGGAVVGPAEGPVMAEWLAGRGVGRERLLVEAEARHTRDNAERLMPLLAARGVEHLTLVTERYHLFRSRVLLQRIVARHGFRWPIAAVAAPDDLGRLMRLGRTLEETAKLTGELVRLATEGSR